MKKILLFLSSVFLISCGNFTVLVKDNDVKINDEAVASGTCKEYSAGWLGIGADDVHYQVGEGEETHLDVGNWIIENGTATEADEACEVSEKEPAITTVAITPVATTPATGTTPDSVATVKTAANCTAADSGGTWSPATSSCSCPAGKVVSDTTGKCATPPPTL